jgi:Domain of unknown function (DUF1772)
MNDAAATAFLVAASVHAGFLATVTTVVYPALARVRAAHWRQAHDRHSRSIAPMLVVTYVAVAGTGAWWLAIDWSTLAAVAVLLAVLSMAVTAVLAAPLHRRLVRRDDALIDRLLRVDRMRTVLSAAAVGVAVAAILLA